MKKPLQNPYNLIFFEKVEKSALKKSSQKVKSLQNKM